MADIARRYTGGCLCGGLRYEAEGKPVAAGHCYCADCRKASGSGFIPFMQFPKAALRFNGHARKFTSISARGGDAVRNSCPACSSLVFGGDIDTDVSFTIYAGSLDDPSVFVPKIAIFARDRPSWAPMPPDLKIFDGLPS